VQKSNDDGTDQTSQKAGFDHTPTGISIPSHIRILPPHGLLLSHKASPRRSLDQPRGVHDK
jgi:hypothetical protein